MNIIIFGGQGYLGTHLTYLLKKKKYKVFIVDNCSNAINLFHKKFYTSLNSLPKKNYDIFINLASKAYVHESKKIPYNYYQNNIQSLFKSLSFCKKLSINKYFYISSCSVYNEESGLISENLIKSPKSPYGKSKLICEEIVKSYAKEFQINYLIFRPFNITGSLYPTLKYGETHSPETHLIPNLVLSCLYQKKINIYARTNSLNKKINSNIRDFVYVKDVSQIIINSIKKKIKNETFNIGSGKGYSTIDMLKKVEMITKQKCHYEIIDLHNYDNMSLVADNTKVSNFKLINKYHSIDDIIKSNIKWFNSKIFKKLFLKYI